jgi:hypothetical protein
MMQIKVDLIRNLIDKLLLRLKKEGVDEILIENNLYWQVPIEEMFNLVADPELQVGSLEDDISFLETAFKEDLGTEFLEFERLAALLALLSKMFSYDRLKK